jgi:hypothetical protein
MLLVVLPLFLAFPAVPGPAPAEIRAAVEKALPLLVKAAEGHAEQKTCFACHNQAVPMTAFTAARSRGLAVSDKFIQSQTGHIREFLETHEDGFLEGRGPGGQVDTTGYALFTLDRAGYPPDAVTAAAAEYLLKRDAGLDYWRPVSKRPPSEASPFTTTYMAARALKTWSTPGQKDRVEKKLAAVRRWLLATPATDTEDRVFRLRALAELGMNRMVVGLATAELLALQRSDGGWSQLETLPSDPYATGSVLVALHEAGGLPTNHPAYRRGLAFLLDTQHADGSWYVKSRSRPFQPYYESGFPHVKDQFISSAASGWAAAALVLALPPRQAGE